MKIADSDESLLILWLADAINKSFVTSWGIFCEDLEAPNLSEQASARFERILDGGGLTQAFEEELFRHILTRKHEVSDDDAPAVTSLEGYSDTIAIAKEILSKIINTPRKYRIIVRAPQVMSDATKGRRINLKLSNKMTLVSENEISSEINFLSGNNLIDNYIYRNSGIESYCLAPGHLYFSYDASGYIGSPHNSKIFNDFTHEMRSFYGACLVHNILYPYRYYREYISPIIMAVEKSSHLITNISTLDTDLVDCTYFIRGGNINKKYLKPENFYNSMKQVVKFFSSQNEKLKTAATWLLRAKLSDRPIDKVLESAIALEVLLGDQSMSDRIGLTKLIANRCAYALGKTSLEREDYLNFFIKFYKIRSEIVHTGKINLGKNDSEIVTRGMELASNMIAHEQLISTQA